MMKKLLLMIIGLMVASYLNAQTGWIQVNSNLAAGRGIGQISIGMLDQDALWAMAVDNTGAIVDAFTRSTNGGVNWTAGTFNAGTGLSQLFAIDATTCWAVFNTGATQGLYKTVNGGLTWTKKGTAFGASSFADIMHFFNENDGVAMGDPNPVGVWFEIYTTTDGGESWTRVPQADIPAPYASDEYGITANYDAADNHIWFGTNYGRVFHSADKGYHWTAAISSFGTEETVQPEFADTLNGIVYRSYLNLGIEPAIGVTTDGGATWQTVYVTGIMYARYIINVPGTTGTYVGSSATAGANGISYSSDGGYTWEVINEGYNFTASAWLDNETGWAGSYATAAESTGGMYIYDGPPLVNIASPQISVTPDALTQTSQVGTIASQEMTISNTGDADLEYQINIIYPAQGLKNSPLTAAGTGNNSRSLSYPETAIDPNAKPSGYNPPTDDVVLHYDSDNYTSIYWNSPDPITPTVAARFTADMTLPYAGMTLYSVDFYINNTNPNFTLKIWDMGNQFEPGTLLVSKPITPMGLSWNNIVLDNPVTVTGGDIWVGYEFTQPDTNTSIPGCDAGPANPNGNYYSVGGSWGHITLDFNWNIRANLNGTPMTQWLSVAPASGTVTPGNAAPITVTFDATNLTVGTYQAILRIQSNDSQNPQIDVPVTLEVTPGGTPQQLKLDFEEVEDWVLTFDPWTTNDADGGFTYPIPGVTFPHSGEQMAYIAFNPDNTTPPMSDDPAIQPHGGVRFGACIATLSPPFNNDWVMSPPVALGFNSSLTLWVKSYTDDYGLEKYNIGVSTTGNNPADFTIISGPTPLLAPADAWEEVNFDLAVYDNQTVYVGIQCVSEDALVFMVDDITIDFFVGTPEIPVAGNTINVYPNPAADHMTISSEKPITEIEIFNYVGQKVFSQVVKNTTFTMSTTGFSTGVYYVRVKSGDNVITRKVMIQ